MPLVSNPPISNDLRVVSAVESLVLLVTGGLLFFAPGVAVDLWPWPLTPFSTRFLGAIYLSSIIPIAAMVVIPHWSPARIVLPPLLAFTVIVLTVSLSQSSRFGSGFYTWLWFALYIALPANTAWQMYHCRRNPRVAHEPMAPSLRWLALVAGGVMGFYGLALLIAPDTATDFWPWTIDAFHARMYSAPFVAGAVGLLLLPPRSTRTELLVAGTTQAALGLLAIVGLLLVDRPLNRVDYSEPGTWGWIALFAGIAAAGALLALRGSREET